MVFVASPDLDVTVSLPMATVKDVQAQLDTAIRLGRAWVLEFDDDAARGYLMVNPGSLGTIWVIEGELPSWARHRSLVRAGPLWDVPDTVPTRAGEPVLDVG